MGYIAFDLDGTLALHQPGAGVDTIGAPIPRMVARVKKYLDEGREVRIITARVSPEWNDQATQRHMIEQWCSQHIGFVLKVQAHKCGQMIKLYDDRAIGVVRNTGVLLHESCRDIEVARAAERVRAVFAERTSINMDPRIAEALAEAVLNPFKDNA